MLNKLKKVCAVFILILYLALFAFASIKVNYVYIFPAVFEVAIMLLSGYKYKKYNKVMIPKLVIVKNLVLLITLILGITSNYISINEILLKCMLTITIVLETLIFVVINRKVKKR